MPCQPLIVRINLIFQVYLDYIFTMSTNLNMMIDQVQKNTIVSIEDFENIMAYRNKLIDQIMIVLFATDCVAKRFKRIIANSVETHNSMVELMKLVCTILPTFSTEEHFVASVSALKIMCQNNRNEYDLFHKFQLISKLLERDVNLELTKKHNQLFIEMYGEFITSCNRMNIYEKHREQFGPINEMVCEALIYDQ